jgi:divalent metal cation (Fe/Co/Zn/Cd) transporter
MGFNLIHNVFLHQPRKTMKHHKYHQHYQVKAAKLHARADAALSIALACAIGIGLAACLFYGLSS